MLSCSMLATVWGASLCAQGIAGTWQGTLTDSGHALRIVIAIAKGGSGGWMATAHSIDEGPDGYPASAVTIEGSRLKLVFDAQDTYEGTLSPDAGSIGGTWVQGGNGLPLTLKRATKATAWPLDPSPHTVRFIPVDTNVRLEVLDWGGTGRPVVFLTGLGNNAHVFDMFAPKFTPQYHVYGITRRGYGISSHPVPTGSNYSADRLGDDILAVLDSLKIVRPVLVGHSIAGEEMSSIGSRHPDRAAGLVYLDAGYAYAFYNQARGDLSLDLIALQEELKQLRSGPFDTRPVIQQLLETSLPRFERDLKETKDYLDAQPPAMLKAYASPSPDSTFRQAIATEEEKYTNIPVPILAIYAEPHGHAPAFAIKDSTVRAAADARDSATVETQAEAFAAANPSVRVVRLPHADHYVFISNQADVLREINAFIASLPP
jgi:pimeloyl-ACP methyl ester carboxylesterase